MQLLAWSLAVLPAIALVGPLLIGWYFGSSWVLKAGAAFNGLAVVLGLTCLVLFNPTRVQPPPASVATVELLMYLSGGLVVFGALFGVLSVVLLFRKGDGEGGGG